MSAQPIGAFAVAVTLIALVVAWDLFDGFRTGKLRLPMANRQENVARFWFYAGLEAALVLIVLFLWLRS
jgi:hypothetical protein